MNSKKYNNSLYCDSCKKFYTDSTKWGYDNFEECPSCGYKGQELIIIEEDTYEGFCISIMDEAVLSFHDVNSLNNFIKVIKKLTHNSGRKLK